MLHRVFLVFPVFLLGLWDRMAVGTRRVGPTRPTDGKEKTNFECWISNVEVGGALEGLKRPILGLKTRKSRFFGPKKAKTA